MTRALVLLALCACQPVEVLSSGLGRPCVEDHDCGVGALCVGDVCTACPDLTACVPPPGDFSQLSRNGCDVCEFGPAAQCYGPSDCAQTCYRGELCASDCVRLECCANVCAAAGCPALAPLGCAAICPANVTCAGKCVTTACRCEAGAWTCDVACGDGLSFGCSYP